MAALIPSTATSSGGISAAAFDIVTEAIFRTLDAEESRRLAGDDLSRAMELLGIGNSGDAATASLTQGEFQEMCLRKSAAGEFELLEAVCSLQRNGVGSRKSGIALFDWENGELNESFRYIDSNNSDGGWAGGDGQIAVLCWYWQCGQRQDGIRDIFAV